MTGKIFRSNLCFFLCVCLINLVCLSSLYAADADTPTEFEDNSFGITADQFKTAQDKIVYDIKIRSEVGVMKKKKGMTYHDNSALKQDLLYLRREVNHTAHAAIQTIKTENKRQIKSTTLRMMKDLKNTIAAKEKAGTLNLEAFQKTYGTVIDAGKSLKAKLTHKIANQHRLLEEENGRVRAYKSELVSAYGPMESWNKEVRQQYDKRTTGVGQLAVGKKNLEKNKLRLLKPSAPTSDLNRGLT